MGEPLNRKGDILQGILRASAAAKDFGQQRVQAEAQRQEQLRQALTIAMGIQEQARAERQQAIGVSQFSATQTLDREKLKQDKDLTTALRNQQARHFNIGATQDLLLNTAKLREMAPDNPIVQFAMVDMAPRLGLPKYSFDMKQKASGKIFVSEAKGRTLGAGFLGLEGGWKKPFQVKSPATYGGAPNMQMEAAVDAGVKNGNLDEAAKLLNNEQVSGKLHITDVQKWADTINDINQQNDRPLVRFEGALLHSTNAMKATSAALLTGAAAMTLGGGGAALSSGLTDAEMAGVGFGAPAAAATVPVAAGATALPALAAPTLPALPSGIAGLLGPGAKATAVGLGLGATGLAALGTSEEAVAKVPPDSGMGAMMRPAKVVPKTFTGSPSQVHIGNQILDIPALNIGGSPRKAQVQQALGAVQGATSPEDIARIEKGFRNAVNTSRPGEWQPGEADQVSQFLTKAKLELLLSVGTQ